jgi:hypothetical protein
MNVCRVATTTTPDVRRLRSGRLFDFAGGRGSSGSVCSCFTLLVFSGCLHVAKRDPWGQWVSCRVEIERRTPSLRKLDRFLFLFESWPNFLFALSVNTATNYVSTTIDDDYTIHDTDIKSLARDVYRCLDTIYRRRAYKLRETVTAKSRTLR